MGQKQRPAVVAEAVTYEVSQMKVSDNTYSPEDLPTSYKFHK